MEDKYTFISALLGFLLCGIWFPVIYFELAKIHKAIKQQRPITIEDKAKQEQLEAIRKAEEQLVLLKTKAGMTTKNKGVPRRTKEEENDAEGF